MNHLRTVFRFGWPYLRRYWGRLAAGIFCGVLFGLFNASFVWSAKTLIDRMNPDAKARAAVVASASSPNDGPAAGMKNVPPNAASLKGIDGSPVNETLRKPMGSAATFRQRVSALNQTILATLDPWMPLMGRKPDWRQMVGGLLFLPVFVGLRGVCNYLSSYCMAWVSERAMSDLRVDLVTKLSSLSLDFFNRSRMGDLVTRINGDAAMLQRSLSFGSAELVKEPITIVSVLVGLCLINFQLTAFSLLFIGLLAVPILVLGRKLRKAAKAGVQAGVQQSNMLLEFIAGIRVVKAFGLESAQIARFQRNSRELVKQAMKMVQASAQTNPIMETLGMTGIGVLLVFIFATQKEMSDVVAFLTGVVLVFTPLKRISILHMLLQQTSPGVDRIIQLMSEQPSVKEAAQPQALGSFQTGIEFRDVSFAYAERPVLQHFNLTIPRGIKLGIAGESGSGKSTLVNLLLRFYDVTGGSVLIDGHDLRTVSTADLRQHIAMVSQEIVIFDQTAAENIACGKADATREEVEAAARAADAHPFIERLPQGYDTRLAERGQDLSGGQRARLCIARAFIRNAPILVLDEATASLDSQSESEVQGAIEKLEENRTVICVAHRLSTLANMDKIIVLAEGRIVEEGTFQELLARGGTFADMARRQGMG